MLNPNRVKNSLNQNRVPSHTLTTTPLSHAESNAFGKELRDKFPRTICSHCNCIIAWSTTCALAILCSRSEARCNTIAAADSNGVTPAHSAALNGHDVCLRALHELGPDHLAYCALLGHIARLALYHQESLNASWTTDIFDILDDGAEKKAKTEGKKANQNKVAGAADPDATIPLPGVRRHCHCRMVNPCL